MSTVETKRFKHVNYLWNEAKAAELAGDEAVSYTHLTLPTIYSV